MNNKALSGSERIPLVGARILGPADPHERFEVSVLLRRRAQAALSARVAGLTGKRGRRPLSREEFAKKHGANPKDVRAIRAFAKTHGLSVVQVRAEARTVILAGTVAQFNGAFGVQLQHMVHEGGTYRGRQGTVLIPEDLHDVVEAVLGLDNRPQAKTHFRLRGASAHVGAAAPISYTPPQVAALYGFPASTGQGQCVGLIELGGGFRPADLATYFSGLNVGSPTVTAVSVDHATNSPTGSANGPDGEVMLDVEVVGSIAPQAHVAVYFAPNTDAGFSMP